MSANRRAFSGIWDAGSISFLAVEGCSKAVSELNVVHGKSPCFSSCCVLRAVGVGWRLLFFGFVDGGFFLD